MNAFEKQFGDLLVDIYRTDFADAHLKLDKFERQFPEELTSTESWIKVSRLRAQIFRKNEHFDAALQISLQIWDQVSVNHVNYLYLGLDVVDLYSDLGENDLSKKFAQIILQAILEDTIRHEPFTLLKLLQIAGFPLNTNPRFVDLLSFIEENLNIKFPISHQEQFLNETIVRIKQEGEQLTQLRAEIGIVSNDESIQNFVKFLKAATTPMNIRSASKHLNLLMNKS